MTDTDLELLRRFTRDHAQAAFTELVRRQVNLVFTAALRQVRSPQLAEEVAQSVFTDLARDAGKLTQATGGTLVLTAWLYAVTRRTAIDVVRQESRRQAREQIAVQMNALHACPDVDWTQIAPLLDEAMAALDETDRAAVLLRFFENQSLREVGAALGASEDAAQKRVSRAVERLREYFAQRGVTTGAGGFCAAISANAVQAAPMGLAVKIASAAILSVAAVHSTGVIAITTLQKAIVGITLAAAVGMGIYAVMQARNAHAEAAPSRPATLLEIQELFDLATAAKPDRCRFEADIEVTTPPYSTEQVKTTLAGIENFMRDANARLQPQQKAAWEVDQSNAIVKAHSGKRIQHVREWYSGNYYRLDINDEGMGEERFMSTHPNEYFQTWVNIPNSPFSPYASYQIQRELHDMVLYQQKAERFHQYNLWQALKMNQEVASLFVGSLINLHDTNHLKRPFFDYRGLKMDVSRAQQLHARTNSTNSFLISRLDATDENLDGKAVTHFTLKWSFTLPPGIKSDYKPDTLQGEMWVGQLAGKVVCLQELMTNLTQHASTVVKRQKYDGDGFPVVWTTTKISADSSFRKGARGFQAD